MSLDWGNFLAAAKANIVSRIPLGIKPKNLKYGPALVLEA
jgi:hypothetical protein